MAGAVASCALIGVAVGVGITLGTDELLSGYCNHKLR